MDDFRLTKLQRGHHHSTQTKRLHHNLVSKHFFGWTQFTAGATSELKQLPVQADNRDRLTHAKQVHWYNSHAGKEKKKSTSYYILLVYVSTS